MTDKPDFVVDPSGNSRDVRSQKYSREQPTYASQSPGTGPSMPGGPTGGSKKRYGIIVIPIGLIITLIIVVLRQLGGLPGKATYSESSVNDLNMGVQYYNDGNYAMAILHFNMALQSEPDMGEAYNDRGLAYYAMQQNDKAIADFDKAIQLMPDPATPYSNRGAVYRSLGNTVQAMADLNKAIELDPKLAKAYHNRGLTRLDMGDYDDAIADFSEAIDLTPEFIFSMESTMESRAPTGQNLLSKGILNDMMNMQKYADLPNAYFSRAFAYLKKSDYQSANADLEKAVQLGLDPAMAGQLKALLTAQASVPTPANNENNATAPADAVPTSPAPEDRNIRALVMDPLTPSILYAGTSGGVFKSTDGGDQWHAASAGLAAGNVNILVIDPINPGTLYAVTDAGLFKSTNGAESWIAVNTEPMTSYISALVVDPKTPATLYAGTLDSVYKTADGGRNWKMNPVEPENVMSIVFSLAIDPITPSTLYVCVLDGVFKSTNSGETWSAANNGLPKNYIKILAVDPSVPTTLYTGTEEGLFKSTDGGESWSRIFGSSPITSLTIDPLKTSTLYLESSLDGWVYSTDGGGNWTVIYAIQPDIQIKLLAVDPLNPGVLYAGTSGGVFKSTGSVQNWTPVNNGLFAQ